MTTPAPPPLSADRPRPRFRRGRVLLALGAALVVGWIAREIWWSATAVPAPVVDYAAALAELAASHQPPGENAWPAYAAIVADFAVLSAAADAAAVEQEIDGEFRNGLDLSAMLSGPVADTERNAPERRLLAAIATGDLPDRLDRLAASPRAIRIITAPPPLFSSVTMPDLAHARALSRARLVAMRRAAARGDEATRVRTLEHALALARVTGSQATIIERLVGQSIVVMALTELQFELIEHPVDAATLSALRGVLDRQLLRSPPEAAVEAERLLFRDTVQWVYTDDGHGDGRLDTSRLGGFGGGGAGGASGGDWLGGLLAAGRKDTLAKADEYFDGMARNAGLPPATRATEGFDTAAFRASLGRRYFLLRLLVPALDKAFTQDDRIRRREAATRAILAIEAFRARHGRPPTTLAELVPDFAPTLPEDPTTGTPFRYRTHQRDPDGRGYVLETGGVEAEPALNPPRPASDG